MNSKPELPELRGWAAIAKFLSMPQSTVHRWAKQGMPVRRAGRNVVASPAELNDWLQRSSGEPVGVHVATGASDLVKDLRASIGAQTGIRKPPANRETTGEHPQHPGLKLPKRASRDE